MSKRKSFQIAIDGPVAAGCSTVARLLAERLHFLYVDTGAMYRVVALLCLRNKVDMKDETAVLNILRKSQIEMHIPTGEEKDGRLITVLLNSEDVSWRIRTDEISQYSAIVALHPQVREFLVKKQQQIASEQNVVMEGRDITYKVLPEADLKIYMTASIVVRTKRRHQQELSKGRDVSFEKAQEELEARDKHDMERKTDPLQIVSDAWIIDTSDLSIEQVVGIIADRAKMMMMD